MLCQHQQLRLYHISAILDLNQNQGNEIDPTNFENDVHRRHRRGALNEGGIHDSDSREPNSWIS